ncbi:hypothetical protein Q4583_05355 [Neptunomonas phycophila]|uniref:hypothetical protein n=1 Tax=Neptunomonas phycophila TaxID=1572645 RepID=UPI001BE5A1EC|nr:hypothetical protein [Neptunomonas phycophila]MBT3147011.1 hypothetical protein [Neptunomonas phycophila]MDO6783533.1 hypothetical protein [Neptunomonas phycophila]
MKLPESYEKDYLEALEFKSSDGAVKNRRNLLVAAFSICSVYVLGKSLTDIKILGINLEGTNKFYLLCLAAVLILYWSVMYFLHYYRDSQLNLERKALLDKHVDRIKQQVDFYNDKISTNPNQHLEQIYNDALEQYKIHLSQLKRTNKAAIASRITNLVEVVLPFLVGGSALIFLWIDLVRLFQQNP